MSKFFSSNCTGHENAMRMSMSHAHGLRNGEKEYSFLSFLNLFLLPLFFLIALSPILSFLIHSIVSVEPSYIRGCLTKHMHIYVTFSSPVPAFPSAENGERE